MARISEYAAKYRDSFRLYLQDWGYIMFCLLFWSYVIWPVAMTIKIDTIIFLAIFGISFTLAIIASIISPIPYPDDRKQNNPFKEFFAIFGKKFWKELLFLLLYSSVCGAIAIVAAVLTNIRFNVIFTDERMFALLWAIFWTFPSIKFVCQKIKERRLQ